MRQNPTTRHSPSNRAAGSRPRGAHFETLEGRTLMSADGSQLLEAAHSVLTAGPDGGIVSRLEPKLVSTASDSGTVKRGPAGYLLGVREVRPAKPPT